MQPIMDPGKNALTALNYNEVKLNKGTAERIKAENFLKDHDRLSRAEIVERFRQRSSLDERLGDEGIHITLNFGSRENPGNELMAVLATRYMTGLGFDDQPYIVYRHYDAGHPHLHVVASTVTAEGNKIYVRPRDYHRGHSICRALEKEFTLEKSIAVHPDRQEEFAVDHAQKVVYGETSLKHAMSDVLNTVFDHYNYTSLDEYNAIHGQYNVTANRGNETSRLYQGGGLFYHTLDEKGKYIGTPIKASAFLVKPTLKNLEQKFLHNQEERETLREGLSSTIGWALAGSAPTWEGFKASLAKEGIDVILTTSKDAGEKIFFVDHSGRSSFEGKNLGEAYEPEALRHQFDQAQVVTEERVQQQTLRLHL